MKRSHIADFSVYFVIRLLICTVQGLSPETCVALSRMLATLFARVLKIRGAVVDDNLRCAYPQMSPQARRRLAWEMWEHLFLLVGEVAHAPRKIHDTNWRDYIRLRDADLLVRAMLDDRPTVLVSGHYGNFELSGYILGILGLPTFTIARPLDNPYLDRFLNEFRGAKGQHILPKNGSAQRIEGLLAQGGSLALLADQHAGPKGCWVDFFGRPASTHKAIALFTLSSDAPLVVCFTRRSGRLLHAEMGATDVADPRTMNSELRTVPALTRWYTERLEKIIRVDPRQYWWVHRRWKDPRPRRAAQAA